MQFLQTQRVWSKASKMDLKDKEMEKCWLDLYGSEEDKYLESGKEAFGLISEGELFERPRPCPLLKNNFAPHISFIPKQCKFFYLI